MQVRIHRNLNRDCLSVTCWQPGHALKGRVIAYCQQVMLESCRFIVNEGSRQTVLREHCRNVHAWVQGRWTWAVGLEKRYEFETNAIGLANHLPAGLIDTLICEVGYNPFRAGNFTRRSDHQAVLASRRVLVGLNGAYIEDIELDNLGFERAETLSLTLFNPNKPDDHMVLLPNPVAPLAFFR